MAKNIEKAYDILAKYGVLERLQEIFKVFKPMTKAEFVTEVLENQAWITKIYLFIDMDNTLFRFSYGKSDDSDVLERVMDKGFFKELPPYANIEIYEALQLMGVNLFILSACPNSKFARPDKKYCLNTHMPFITDEHMIFCEIGQNKAEIAMARAGIDNLNNAVLIDDYKGNLLAWQAAGGIAIKKAISYKTRPYPTLIDHKDSVDMVLSLGKERQ